MSKSDKVGPSIGLEQAPVPLDQCGMAKAAETLGDRWALLVLREITYGVTRFDDLQAELRISSATLSNRLRRLMEQGLLESRPYRQPGDRPRTEYLLSDAGRGLGLVLFAMMAWADDYLPKDPSPLKLVHRETGKELRLALVDEDGQVAEQEDAVPLILNTAQPD